METFKHKRFVAKQGSNKPKFIETLSLFETKKSKANTDN